MSPFRQVLIRASAGTGKTFQLTNRYLGLLDQGVAADQILAVTFTRKAAGEILDRIVMRLADAALSEDSRGKLRDALQAPGLTRKRCLELLVQLTRSLHRLRIGTLDSFFAQLASSLSLELGLPPGWSIVEEVQKEQLRDEAIAGVLRAESLEDLTRLMHLMSKGASERSVSSLIRDTVAGLHTLFQETEAPAWDRIPRGSLVGADELQATLAKLQTVALPSHKRIVAARDEEVQLALAGDWETFLEKGIAGCVATDKTTYYGKELSDEVCSVYRLLLRHARAVVLEQLAEQTKATYELLRRFDVVFRRRQLAARALRFDDVTRYLVDGLDEAALERQAFRLDAQLHHLLLDEFQDTSLRQWRVIRPFAERLVLAGRTGREERRSFFCVGDEKQAIYGWRGGAAELMGALAVEYPTLEQLPLSRSYRSSPIVIETVNAVFQRMGQHPALDDYESAIVDWQDSFPEHSTALERLPGYACLIAAPRGSDKSSSDDATLSFAAKQVQEIVQRASGRSVGVLVRDNASVAQMIFELRRLGVPASEEGGNPLTDSAAVQVVLAWFRLVDHPGDSVARFHVLRSPLAAVLGLRAESDDAALDEAAAQFRRRLLEAGYGPVVYQLVEGLAPSCHRRDLSRLLQLVERAYAYQTRSTLRPSDFVEQVERLRVPDPQPADVRVMTIHQSKGLEFDAVVLPQLDGRLLGERPPVVVGRPTPTAPIDRVCRYRKESIQQILPRELQQLFENDDRQSLVGELCVLYVALTRAVHELRLIAAASSSSEKQLPKTPAGLIRAALTDGGPLVPERLAFELGDLQWHDKLKQFDERAEPAKPVLVPTVPASIAFATGRRSRTGDIQTSSPSTLEGGPRRSLSGALQLENAAARSQGTLLHAWLERVAWLEDGLPADGELQRIAAAHGVHGVEFQSMLGEFRRCLARPKVATLLSRQSYRQPADRELLTVLPKRWHETGQWILYRELSMLARRQGELVTGVADRVILFQQADRPVAAEIIDFKTDWLGGKGEGLRQRVEFYRPQLDAYRDAAAAMYRLAENRIVCRLVFVRAGEVVGWTAPS